MRRTLGSRYWPFLLIAAVPLVLIVTSDERQGLQTGGFGAGSAGLSPVSGVTPGSGSGGGTGGDTAGTSGGVASVAGARGTGSAATGTDPGGSGAGGATAGGQAASTSSGAGAAASASGGSQPVDELGRPLDGDRSRCAPGGLVQEDITLQSPPCMPALAGDNGGATYRGVTADTIKVVVYYEAYEQGVQQVLAANELAMTDAQAEELHGIYEEFFNRHYELYGRQLEVVGHQASATTPIEYRAEAKAVVERHQPFAVLYYAQGLMPTALADQLSREQVLAVGATPVADEFYTDRAPFVWSQVIQGYRMADLAADYYCKKMHGKPASLAGDPTMRLQTRKLGIGSSEDPAYLKVQERFLAQVTGGMCGSPQDGAVLYTYSSDPDVAESQRPALVRRMRDDGITTTYELNPCAEGDQQRYYPENMTAQVFDDDYVGRVFAALCSPTQMENVFGIGMFPHASPREDKEFHRAARSVNPSYSPPYLAEGPFQGLIFLSGMIQYAGPNLTPATIYQGTRSMPQIAGWSHPNPWPGWTCCNPYTPGYHVGVSPDSFTAKIDARQVYWTSTQRSEGDGATGAWVGVDQSRRYRIGEWPAGEPKQP